MRITSLLISILVALFLVSCSSTAVQLSTPTKKVIKREIGNSTLREKIARIGKVKFLYASHPVEYINLSESKAAILTDEYWFPRVNIALRGLCDGKQVADQTVVDSFTGQQTIKNAPVDNTTRNWECTGESIDFSINSIASNSSSQANLSGAGSLKVMIIIESSYSGKPVLSEYQLKMMSKYTENVSLKEFLDSKFALIGGKTATHARPKSDSALYQEYFKKYSKVTDIAKDLGILYDLNMLCGSDGGFAAPIKGYKKSDIARSLIPDDATFQCTSKVRPFYVRFSSLSKNKYAIYVKEDMLDASRFADSTPQNSSDTNMSLKEMLANKLQEQIRATDTYKYKYVLAVSESNPIMSIRDMNYVTEVHWINRQGQCDSIAAITTNKDINKIDKIENYIRCGTSIKNIGDTKLPTKLPATFESNIDTYFRIIERVDISAE